MKETSQSTKAKYHTLTLGVRVGCLWSRKWLQLSLSIFEGLSTPKGNSFQPQTAAHSTHLQLKYTNIKQSDLVLLKRVPATSPSVPSAYS